MTYALHRATLALHTSLGTPLAGDTLFGQLCWTLREVAGESELNRQLDGYTQGRPWLIVSDGFPAGFLPKPTLPQHFEPQHDPAGRKAAKKKHWIPADRTDETLTTLLASAVNDTSAYLQADTPLSAMRSHNTINRLTGSTGEGFAPYTQPQTFHVAGQRMHVYLVLDEERITAGQAEKLLATLGSSGFGRDASIGLGKFTVEQLVPATFASPVHANAYWTLAPCMPQGQGFDSRNSYWRMLTRFGRHGNAHALAGNPFKTPVLMAASGAVLTPAGELTARVFVGQGLGGGGKLSKAEPSTVHQGYAPVVQINLESK